jgi:hypothetical protein
MLYLRDGNNSPDFVFHSPICSPKSHVKHSPLAYSAPQKTLFLRLRTISAIPTNLFFAMSLEVSTAFVGNVLAWFTAILEAGVPF